MINFKRLFLIIISITFFFNGIAFSQYKKTPQKKEPFYGYLPYVPKKREYNFEMGSMWEKQTLYWLGFKFGLHLGTCLFSEATSCQQYVDVISGAGGRNGQTNGFLLGGLRWQFINFPKLVSPSFGIYAGAMDIQDDVRNQEVVTYAFSYAQSISVHKNIDLKLEYRFGGGQREWSQLFLSIGVTLDDVIGAFAGKVKDIGRGSVYYTGKVLKKTGSITKDVLVESVETVKKVPEILHEKEKKSEDKK